MDSMLAQSLRDHGFEPRWGQIKEYKIVICCSTTKFRNKNKDWFAWNQYNVYELNNMF
jgi:hypothetical protein